MPALEKHKGKLLTGKMTRFIVAQRISTVLNADKIIVMDKGRVVAQGTHKALLQTSPIYQEIYESQLGKGFHTDETAGILEGV